MSLRERTLAALAGEEVFPIPVDVYGNRIYPELEARLCRHFGLAARDHEGVMRALGGCVRYAAPPYTGPQLEEVPWEGPVAFPHQKVTRDIWGVVSGIMTWHQEIARPLGAVDSLKEIEAYPWPDPAWFDYSRLGRYTDIPDDYVPLDRWRARHADRVRIVGGYFPVFGQVMDLCGAEAGLMLLASRPDLVDAIVAHIEEYLYGFYERMAVACAGTADYLVFGDDFAGQNGMLLSPRAWRRHFLPIYRRLFDLAHRHGFGVWFHSCGAVRPVLRDLVDAGLNVHETLQVAAAGMNPAELKRDFGPQLAFYGGIDTQSLLPRGAPADVRREVRLMGDLMGRGGRYIMASAHFMMDDIPLENVLAMYAEAHSYVPDSCPAHAPAPLPALHANIAEEP